MTPENLIRGRSSNSESLRGLILRLSDCELAMIPTELMRRIHVVKRSKAKIVVTDLQWALRN